jgi:molybdopterin-guanine dinucleotide biosynthesis protein B
MNSSRAPVPMVAFVGPSNSGKTTLLKKVIRILRTRGYRVGALKHTHHEFEIDRPGKDSYELKSAGAEKVCIVSPTRLGFVSSLAEEKSPEEVAIDYFSEMDLVLVEGFKHYALPQVAVARGSAPLPQGNQVIAFVSDYRERDSNAIRHFDFGQIEELANFLEESFLK